jgi:DNA repair protein RadA/Sms
VARPSHLCSACGASAPRWSGRCPGCGEWNTLAVARGAPAASPVAPLSASLRQAAAPVPTGVGELDRVLGGGLAAGSTTLLFGEPGVGKSTLALMALVARSAGGEAALLVAAEESPSNVAARAARLGAVPEALDLAATSDAGAIESLIRERRPALCVVDSVSAVADRSLAAPVGSVPQVRHAADRLCAAARDAGTALILIGHVTKDGELAGPRALEHVVDTVVRVEGDRHGSLRTLRALKHRFGPTDEVGLVEVAADGLRDVADPSALSGAALEVPGVVVGVALDGSRATRVEVQALVAAAAGPPRRVAHQVSAQRLALLLAVLDARCGVATGGLDVFAASAGGLPAAEPGVDAAVALAVASAALGFTVAPTLAVVGEVGLAGELRPVGGLARRAREARRRGATAVLAPAGGDDPGGCGVRLVRCRSLAEAVAAARSVTN